MNTKKILTLGLAVISLSLTNNTCASESNLWKKPLMLPFMHNRPLTLQRFVHGINEEGFYQKNASDYFPSWIQTITIKKQPEGVVHYIVCNDAETLVYLVNQLTITFHVWLSTIDNLKKPDKMIFDLDPSSNNFASIRTIAKALKKILEQELGLITYIMTTGSRGVHIVVPLDGKATFYTVRTFARDVALLLSERYPDKTTIEIRKNKRGKKIFIDYLRNAFAQTGVAPYSVRAIEGAPIATPIDWSELSKIKAQTFTITNIFKRLSRKQCPWQHFGQKKCSLKTARKQLDILIKQTNKN